METGKDDPKNSADKLLDGVFGNPESSAAQTLKKFGWVSGHQKSTQDFVAAVGTFKVIVPFTDDGYQELYRPSSRGGVVFDSLLHPFESQVFYSRELRIQTDSKGEISTEVDASGYPGSEIPKTSLTLNDDVMLSLSASSLDPHLELRVKLGTGTALFRARYIDNQLSGFGLSIEPLTHTIRRSLLFDSDESQSDKDFEYDVVELYLSGRERFMDVFLGSRRPLVREISAPDLKFLDFGKLQREYPLNRKVESFVITGVHDDTTTSFKLAGNSLILEQQYQGSSNFRVTIPRVLTDPNLIRDIFSQGRAWINTIGSFSGISVEIPDLGVDLTVSTPGVEL